MVEVLPILTRLSKIFQTENLSFTSIKPAVTRAKSTLHGVDITSMNKTSDWQHELDTYMESNALSDGDPEEYYETCETIYCSSS